MSRGLPDHLRNARRADSAQRRQRVLCAIAELPDGTRCTIAELARRSEVHRSFLYRHEELLEALFSHLTSERVRDLLAERDRLRTVVDAVRAYVEAMTAEQICLTGEEAVEPTARRLRAWARMLDVLHALDGSEATDG